MEAIGHDAFSEALLSPKDRQPACPSQGLQAEQPGGSAFTALRHASKRTWLYRIDPWMKRGAGSRRVDAGLIRKDPYRDEDDLPIGPMRRNPIEIPSKPADFQQGLRIIATCGDSPTQVGTASHV